MVYLAEFDLPKVGNVKNNRKEMKEYSSAISQQPILQVLAADLVVELGLCPICS